MYKFFIEGGPISMAILTVLLVAVFFAAWKAPRWVKEIGSIACAYAFIQLCLGFYSYIRCSEGEWLLLFCSARRI